MATQQATVFDALRQLRPRWLSSRGGARVGRNLSVTVYMGRQRMGTVDFLRTLDPQAVRDVRFYTGSEATTIFGTDAAGGVIEISRR